MKMKLIDWIGFGLVVLGSLNWGLIGAFNFNLVGYLFGPMSITSRIIYTLTALSMIYAITYAMVLGRAQKKKIRK